MSLIILSSIHQLFIRPHLMHSHLLDFGRLCRIINNHLISLFQLNVSRAVISVNSIGTSNFPMTRAKISLYFLTLLGKLRSKQSNGRTVSNVGLLYTDRSQVTRHPFSYHKGHAAFSGW